MKTFFAILQAEHLKSKGLLAFQILLLFPILLTLGINIYLYSKTYNIEYYASGNNPWIFYLARYTFPYYTYFYPILIAVFCHAYCEVEYKNNNLKDVFTLPLKRRTIGTVKIFFIVENILISILIAYSLFLISGWIMSYFHPELGYQDYDIRLISFTYFLQLFIGLMAIALIQFCISLLIRNFVFPVSFACFATLFPIITGQKLKYLIWIPYNEGNIALSDFMQESINLSNKFNYINIGYIAICFLLVFWFFKKLK